MFLDKFMKRFAQKFTALSLVAPNSGNSGTNGAEDRPGDLNDSFDGWLTSIAPSLIQEPPPVKSNDITARWRSLSSIDLTRVNRATVRESSAHRHWPPEVVTSFLAAEVIKRTNKSH